jgi:APA family basic amino acid/polyamine antiporter
MVGTGVFTTLGFQVMEGAIPDPMAILTVWALGGIIALAGATCYSEVASVYPEDGGEYHFLSRLYHPIIGITSGVVSIAIGFAAAIGGLGLAAAAYLTPLLPGGISEPLVASVLIVSVALVQWFGVRLGSAFQSGATALKIGMIAFVVLLPAFFNLPNEGAFELRITDQTIDLLSSLAFPKALVWVMFAYSGWNAATYIVGHLENPKRNLGSALIRGTLAVMLMYLILNYVFMRSVPFEQLAGTIDVGNVVVKAYLGDHLFRVFGAVLAISLMAGLNAMLIAGPRVVQKMANDLKLLPALGREHKNGSPRGGVVVVTVVSLLFVFFGTFNDIVEYVGISLTMFSMLVVFGVFIVRFRKLHNENTIRSFAYPLAPILFLASGFWMIYFFVAMDPQKLLWSISTLVPGVLLYFLSKRKRSKVPVM